VSRPGDVNLTVLDDQVFYPNWQVLLPGYLFFGLRRGSWNVFGAGFRANRPIEFIGIISFDIHAAVFQLGIRENRAIVEQGG
jgi:hypothetical protein